jgi:oxygen-independent coproporphyrinogen III oxidase
VLSLYVHVPFCTDKCLYCDFYSVPRRTVEHPLVQRVVEETVNLARCLVEAAGERSAPARVPTMFIGGGTPSCLPPEVLRGLLGAFSGFAAPEWTVESNPETLSRSFLDACSEAGVTRLSVGIQSLHTALLETLRRRATRDHALSAMRLLQQCWKGDLNLDFITGIPGQTAADVRDDLSVIAREWPGHVSLYQLTVEPGTPLETLVSSGSIQLNAPELDEELWLAGRDELTSRGYQQYEVSNFALPGKECRHNLRYWHIDPYAGAGPGAVSTLPAAWAARAANRPGLAGEGPVVRFSAPKNLDAFLQGREGFWGIETEVVSAADFLVECLMMGLRLAKGIPAELINGRFGSPFQELFPGLWERWVRDGLATASTDTLALTPSGLMVLDHLMGQVAERVPRTEMEKRELVWPRLEPR